ncbi:hypothetical protein OAB94_02105 [Flavobacteriaceae bacterium]|nr:hypothetical protein [Flavobacteriaceae bacterium]
MSNWSARRTFYENPLLHNTTNKEASVTKLLNFCLDENGNLIPTKNTKNVFKNIVSQVNQDQRAVVTGMFATFVQNDFDKEGIVTITGLYSIEGDDNDEGEQSQLLIPCPANINHQILEENSLIYTPTTVSFKEILLYADQEKALFEPTISELLLDKNDEAFSLYYNENHSLINCLISDKKMGLDGFKTGYHEGERCYITSRAKLKMLQSYINQSVFKNIHYTRFENLQFNCKCDTSDAKDGGISILMQLNYVLTQTK